MAEKHVKKSAKRRPARTKTSANGKARKLARQETEFVHEVDRPPAAFRGLMPTPPEVEALVAQIERELPMSAEARQRHYDDFNEQYYFGGNCIAYRNTPHGREILAVGEEELDRLFRRRMTRKERQSIVEGFAEPW